MHSRTAVGLAARAMHLPHPLDQARIVQRPFASRSIAPSVIAAGADAEQTAQAPHRVAFLLLLDEGRAFAFRAEVNAIAFFLKGRALPSVVRRPSSPGAAP